MVGIWVSVVSVVGITIGVWVGSISISSIEESGISISLGLWLSISRSLAVVVSMVGITIGVWVGSISIVSIQSIGISLSFRFSSNSCEQAESSNSNGFHFDVIKLEELAGLPMYSALIPWI